MAAWLLVAYGVVGAALVFEPYPHAADDSVDIGHELLAAIGLGGVVSWGAVEFLLNVALFVPLSFLGAVAIPRIRRLQWVGIGLLFSLTIEFTQLLVFPDRSATVWDVIANTLGALLGALLAVRLRRRAAESSARQDGLETRKNPNR
jgi:hypothetical protein